jgi:hypothetical protein
MASKFIAEQLMGFAARFAKGEDTQGVFISIEKTGKKITITCGSYNGEDGSSHKITAEEVAPSICAVKYNRANEKITRETLLAELRKYGNFDSIALTASVEKLQKIKSCIVSPDLTEDEKGNFLATIDVGIKLYSKHIGVDFISKRSVETLMPVPEPRYMDSLHFQGISII